VHRGGAQSAWLYEILLPHVQELVVVNVTDSRGPKSDERDAFALAENWASGRWTSGCSRTSDRTGSSASSGVQGI
jgi:hypothetical protein